MTTYLSTYPTLPLHLRFSRLILQEAAQTEDVRVTTRHSEKLRQMLQYKFPKP